MTAAGTAARTEIRPRRTGSVHDTVSIARRAIRQLPRDIAFIGPTLFIPLFFLVINVASLSEAAAFVDLGITGSVGRGVDVSADRTIICTYIEATVWAHSAVIISTQFETNAYSVNITTIAPTRKS